MGVLLILQTMDKARFDSLGQNYEEETLKRGMEFLKAAGNTSSLAARYVAMLQRIRNQAKPDELIHSISENGRNVDTIRNRAGVSEPLLTLAEATACLPRRQNDAEAMLDLEFVDFMACSLERVCLGSYCLLIGQILKFCFEVSNELFLVRPLYESYYGKVMATCRIVWPRTYMQVPNGAHLSGVNRMTGMSRGWDPPDDVTTTIAIL
jgi:hypothetical protein